MATVAGTMSDKVVTLDSPASRSDVMNDIPAEVAGDARSFKCEEIVAPRVTSRNSTVNVTSTADPPPGTAISERRLFEMLSLMLTLTLSTSRVIDTAFGDTTKASAIDVLNAARPDD